MGAPLTLERPPLLFLGQVEPEAEPKAWTRTEKLALAGVVLTAVGLLVYALK